MSESDNGSYWNSLEGLLTRISDIAHNFTWGSLGDTIKGIFGSEPAAKKLIFKTAGDDVVCPICTDLQDSEYTEDDELLPDMPQHVSCRCYFEVEGEEDVPEN